MTSNKQHWSYLAAMIDGEGHIAIIKNYRDGNDGHHKQSYYLYFLALGINGTDLRLMKWLVQYFGGVYYSRDRKDKWAVAYEWRPKGKKNREEILLGILPYLVIKAEQAKLALEFLRLGHVENPQERDRLYQQSRLLNRRGKPVETDTPSNSSELMIQSELTGDSESDPVGTLAS